MRAERDGEDAPLLVRNREPFNAEPPLEALRQSFVTPIERFFVRSHGPVPAVDTAGYRLQVNGLVREPLSLSLTQLRERFGYRTAMATLQCAGNRRAELMAVEPMPGELQWGAGAIGNAVWGGVSLAEVLRACGVGAQARHAAFTGLDTARTQAGTTAFGGSIPLDRALQPDVMLAWEMNGEPLTAAHGSPLRVVVPGWIGARSVKWLGSIELLAEPSSNWFQARSYRLFPAEVRSDTADWTTAHSLGPIALNSAIWQPLEGQRLPPGPIEVRGYAIAAAPHDLAAVEVSGDGGATWVEGAALEGDGHATWLVWQATVDLEPGARQIVARARDAAGNTQPHDAAGIWNFKGYANNAWHRVNVQVDRLARQGAPAREPVT